MTCHNADMQQVRFIRKAKIISDDCKWIDEGQDVFHDTRQITVTKRGKNDICFYQK